MILFFLLMCMLCRVAGQEFAPGPQAQGYLRDKNTTVDYATGTFHYRIPLYTFRSGDFELPITLDYAARAVQKESFAGLTGYNWNLNTGGIVTCQLRGSEADEQGALSVCMENPELVRYGLDGESDVFTAIFNGKTLHFLLDEQLNEILPMERSNVRIERILDPSSSSSRPVLKGWKVTDEDGTRYYFEQKEINAKVNKVATTNLGAGRAKDFYVSAWHLNKIEPTNGSPITYVYDGEIQSDTTLHAHVFNYSCQTGCMYTYGNLMVEYSLGRWFNELAFDQCIAKAKYALSYLPLEVELDYPKYIFSNAGNWVLNPQYEIGQEISKNCIRVMGQIGDFSRISQASSQLIYVLDSYISQFRNSTSPSERSCASYLEDAKGIAVAGMQAKRMVDCSLTTNVLKYKVHAPILKEIRCGNQTMRFDYLNAMLKSIKVCGQFESVLCDFHLIYSNDLLLEKFYSCAKDRSFKDLITFDYFVSEGNAKRCMSSLTTKYGGKVDMNYTASGKGIRIASLIYADAGRQEADTVYYHYPHGGYSVYYNMPSSETIRYKGRDFQDVITFGGERHSSRTGYVCQGNEGIYYPFVTETVRGKGTRAYWFHVPGHVDMTNLPSFPPPLWDTSAPFAYWLCGLPLGTAVYDADGHLQALTRNSYYTDLDFPQKWLDRMFSEHRGHFVAGDEAIHYKDSLLQTEPCDYLMDVQAVESHYRAMNLIDLGGKMLDPYEDIYLVNFACRANPIFTPRCYQLYYGGATLLKSQEEYVFADTVLTDTIRFRDLELADTRQPFKRTEYHYDNLSRSVSPTRIDEIDSRGDTITIVLKRVTDFDMPEDSTWVRMNSFHIVSPVLKNQVYYNGKLQKEQLFRHQWEETDGMLCGGQIEEWCYYPSGEVTLSPFVQDNTWHTFAPSLYRLESSCRYKKLVSACVPVEQQEHENRSVIVYDRAGTTATLVAKDIDPRFIAVEDKGFWWAELEDVGVYNYGTVREIAARCHEHFSRTDTTYADRTRILNLSKWLSTPMNMMEWLAFNMVKMTMEWEKKDSHKMQWMDFRDNLINRLKQVPSTLISADDIRCMCNNVFINKWDGYYWEVENSLKKIPVGPLLVQTNCTEPHEKLTVLPASGCVTVYLLGKGEEHSVTCKVVCASGEIAIPLSCPPSEHWRLHTFELDLSAYPDVSSVYVESNMDIRYIAMMPRDTEFEATVCDSDGTVLARFNQSGLQECYEYDPHLRPCKAYDGQDNLLREYKFNTITR